MAITIKKHEFGIVIKDPPYMFDLDTEDLLARIYKIGNNGVKFLHVIYAEHELDLPFKCYDAIEKYEYNKRNNRKRKRKLHRP